MKITSKNRRTLKAAFAGILSACLLATSAPVAFAAEEQPSAAPAETAAEETAPAETAPAETAPAETAPAKKTVPAKSKAAEASAGAKAETSKSDYDGDVKAVELGCDSITISYEESARIYENGVDYDYHFPQGTELTLSNGEKIYADADGDFLYKNDWVSVDFEDTQNEEEWSVGTHTVYAEIMGGRFKLEVTLADTPVDHVTVEPVTAYADRDSSYGYDPETDSHYEFYEYSYIDKMTVYLKDGTVLKPVNDPLYSYCYYCYKVTDSYGDTISYHPSVYDDQSIDNIWSAGKHKVKCTVMGYSFDFDVDLLSSYITGISAEPLTLTGDLDGYVYSLSKPVEPLLEDTYIFGYDLYEKVEYTVTTADGLQVKCKGSSFEVDGRTYYISINSDQINNRWKPGNSYTATIEVGNVTDEFEVNITESPIERIDVKPVTLSYRRDGRYAFYRQNGRMEYYYHYDLSPEFTVVMKNGETYDCKDIFTYEGEDYRFYVNESAVWSEDKEENLPYTKRLKGKLGGRDVYFDVNVVESKQIKRVELEKSRMFHITDGFELSDYDEEGNVTNKCIYYIPSINGTIYMNDGSKYYINDNMISNKKGETLDENDKLFGSLNTFFLADLEPGNYTLPIEINEFKTTFELEIIEPPVDKVEVEPVYLTVGEDAVIRESYSDGGTYTCYFTPEFTAVMKDGSRIKSKDGEIEYNGGKFKLEYENWNLYMTGGDDYVTIEANLMGTETEIHVYLKQDGKQALMDEESGLSVIVDDNDQPYLLEVENVSPDDLEVDKKVLACRDFQLSDYFGNYVSEKDMVLNYFTEERGDYKAYRVEDDGALTALDTRTKTNECGTMIIINTDKPGRVLIADESKDADFITGDVNGDGAVNGKDAALLARYTSGWDGYADKVDKDAADINGDGKINGQDSAILMRYTSGWTEYNKFFN